MSCLPSSVNHLSFTLDPAHKRMDILAEHLFAELMALSASDRQNICLTWSSRLLEEAAYAIANEGTPYEAVQLFSIAASIETEIERIASRNIPETSEQTSKRST